MSCDLIVGMREIDNSHTMSVSPAVYVQVRRPFGQQREQVQTLLQQILRSPVVMNHRADGAPVLVSHPEVEVSISHCLTAVAVAMAPRGTCVGVDVEDKAMQASHLLRRYAHQAERRILEENGIPPILLWSAKETIYKAYAQRVRRFSEDIRLSRLSVAERWICCDLYSGAELQKGGLRVSWLTPQTAGGTLCDDYADSLVLTYHLSHGMTDVEVVSVPLD